MIFFNCPQGGDNNIARRNVKHNKRLVGEFKHCVGPLVGAGIDVLDVKNFRHSDKNPGGDKYA